MKMTSQNEKIQILCKSKPEFRISHKAPDGKDIFVNISEEQLQHFNINLIKEKEIFFCYVPITVPRTSAELKGDFETEISIHPVTNYSDMQPYIMRILNKTGQELSTMQITNEVLSGYGQNLRKKGRERWKHLISYAIKKLSDGNKIILVDEKPYKNGVVRYYKAAIISSWSPSLEKKLPSHIKLGKPYGVGTRAGMRKWVPSRKLQLIHLKDIKALHELSQTVTGKKICGFSFKGNYHAVSSWKDLLIQLCNILRSIHPKDFDKVLTLHRPKRPYFARNPNELRKPAKIEDTDIYVEINLSAHSIVNVCLTMISLLGYEEDDLSIEVTNYLRI